MDSLREAFREASMQIKTLEDLEPTGTKAAAIVFALPAEIWLLNYVTPWINFGGWVLSKGNRFRWWELLFVVVGFVIDDSCTAIGMQAEEVPRIAAEGNPTMSGAMQWFIQQGFANTETAATRLIDILFMITIFGSHYMGWLSPNSRLFMMFMAAVKAWAGYFWCTLEPNGYTFTDYITFKDGRPTPERMSIPLMQQFNAKKGYGSARRRLRTSTPGLTWINRYLYKIFPYI